MPEWAQVVLAIVAAAGGIAGLVALYTARATRRNLDADTAAKLVAASGELVEQIRKERQDLMAVKNDCIRRLEALERKARLTQQVP